MKDFQFRIGSMVYPQQRVIVDAGQFDENLGESFNELRKCVGVLGNYMHNSYLNPRTFLLGPGKTGKLDVFENNADGLAGLQVRAAGGNAANDGGFKQNEGIGGNTKSLFVAAYGFEGFAKTAAESGINVSDRALPVTCEINREIITRDGGDVVTSQVRYDIFAQTDMIIYLTADGQLSTRV